MSFGCVPRATQSRLPLPARAQSCTPGPSLCPVKVNTKTLLDFGEEVFHLSFGKAARKVIQGNIPQASKRHQNLDADTQCVNSEKNPQNHKAALYLIFLDKVINI